MTACYRTDAFTIGASPKSRWLPASAAQAAVAVFAWLAVGIPLAWGIWITLSNALVLFR